MVLNGMKLERHANGKTSITKASYFLTLSRALPPFTGYLACGPPLYMAYNTPKTFLVIARLYFVNLPSALIKPAPYFE